MKPKKGRSSYVLLVGFLSLLVVGAWLAYQIYAALTRTQITEQQAAAISALSGSIRSDALDNLRARRKFTPAELYSVVLNLDVSPSVTQGDSFGLTQ